MIIQYSVALCVCCYDHVIQCNTLRMLGRELVRSFLNVAFCPPELVFPPLFLENVVEVKASGPPHMIKRWLG